MSAERIQFLASMEVGYDDSDTIIQNLRKELIDNPDKALVHILPVEDISLEVSMKVSMIRFNCQTIEYLTESIGNF